MKQVIFLNKQNLSILNDSGYSMPFDVRIGNFIYKQSYDLLPEDIKNKLTVSESFGKNDISEDVNNPIIILPTVFKKYPIVKELIKQVYLVCNNQEFFVNIGSTIDNGVETPTNLFFTPIEVFEITEQDMVILYGLKDKNDEFVLDESGEPINIGLFGLWNLTHPDMLIEKPIHFINREAFDLFRIEHQK